jgi:hypothetical protein
LHTRHVTPPFARPPAAVAAEPVLHRVEAS